MGPLRSLRLSRCQSFLLLMLLLLFTFAMMTSDLSYPYEPHLSFEEDHVLPVREEPPNSSFLTAYRLSEDYKADFKCVRTKTSPSASVCIYDAWRDMYISHDLEETGVWEPQVLTDIQDTLAKDPSAVFLDIGAHVGYYSLIAAQMGHFVVAVEPFIESCYRLHRAAVIDGTTRKIKLLNNAVADQRVKATIRVSGDNQGNTRIELKTKPCIGSCPSTVKTILLDDILSVVNISHAVMKLDIQGFEHRAFQHAEKLLRSVHISYIFMEWIVMRDFHVPSNQTSDDHFLVEEMILLLFKCGYRPYSLSINGGGPLDPETWHLWPDDIVWHRTLDPGEKLQVMRNHYLNWP